jgi:ABC-type antimicrobial peptide transport system permease subunit
MIGTPKSSIYTMLLVKATILGLVGGIIGYAIGTIAGVMLGPYLAGIIVRPVLIFLMWSILLSTAIAILGSLIPAYLAAKIEPFTIMQEV